MGQISFSAYPTYYAGIRKNPFRPLPGDQERRDLEGPDCHRGGEIPEDPTRVRNLVQYI